MSRPVKEARAEQMRRAREEVSQPTDDPHGPEGGDRPNGGAKKPPRFPLTRFKDIKFDNRLDYLVKGLIPDAGIVVIWGAPKCGKSFFTYDLMMHVALGWEYRGLKVKQGAVVYCALEGSRGFKKRIEAFRRRKLAGQAGADDPPFFLMPTHLSLIADKAQFIAEMRAQLHETRPAAVVIDTLNRSMKGSESDDEAMTAYVLAADAIREAFDCVVIIVHHCGHDQQDRPRGHSSLMGAVENQISVKNNKDTDIISAELELSKDGAAGLKFAFRLVVVELGLDADGDPITSCVVEDADGEDAPAGVAKKPPPKALTDSAKVALLAFDRALAEVGKPSPGSNNIPDVRGVEEDQWKRYAVMMGISPKAGQRAQTADAKERAQNKAFQEALTRLLAVKVISQWGDFFWKP